MKKLLYTFLIIAVGYFSLNAQERYMDEIFDEVSVESNVAYAANISILPIILGQSENPELDTLEMDIYAPMGDDLEQRPVVILAHAGDFLPPIVNTSPYGTKNDFAVTETCKKLAKRGFVAISMEYRIGFNPLGSEIEGKAGVLQASYRLTQDMRTLVRYVRKSVAEDGNPYGFDPDRIAVGGFDNAGWGASNVAHLKTIDQVVNLVKFVDLSTSPPTPFVIQERDGDPYALVQAPLNVPNHVDYSSDVNVVINIEGGVGDLSWVEAGDPPTISFQRAWTFPRGIRDVTLGATGAIIIADGAFLDTVALTSQGFGNQDVFDHPIVNEAPLTAEARAATSSAAEGGLKGVLLYNGFTVDSTILCDPTPGSSENSYGRNSYPWNAYDENLFAAFWDGAGQNPASDIKICQYNASEGNINDPVQSLIFIDTMVTYMAPRLIVAMDLLTTNVDNELKTELSFNAFPNPTSGEMNVQAKENFQRIMVIDLKGRTLFDSGNIEANQYQVTMDHLPNGLYVTKAFFEKGIVTERILVQH